MHELAGRPVPASLLIDVSQLTDQYHSIIPDYSNVAQRVSFGTSGHRGTSSAGSFNEAHILAITQAICEYRTGNNITGPLYLGMDTHALSEAAQKTALEVLAANGQWVRMDTGGRPTPTPAVSRAILAYNASSNGDVADGIVITPSHNPPQDGGFKYNPPSGGPADTGITRQIQDRANALLEAGLHGVKRKPHAQALTASSTEAFDFVTPYVQALGNAIDFAVIRNAGNRIGVHPLGGASIDYWPRIAEAYGINMTIVDSTVDPTFRFMTVDKDGKVRMDCSSPAAMASLVSLKDRFDIAFGNDPDADRHGIVTPGGGLMNPNHYLSVAIDYVFRNRPGWKADAAIGKTLVSSAMIDRVAQGLGRPLAEVPVGFKWFVDGLLRGTYGFGGEESAGASFLQTDGTAWTTDKDGLLLGLLAAEIVAKTGKDPASYYEELTERFGSPVYERMDAPATPDQQAVLAALSPEQVRAQQLAGDPIVAKLTTAPANDAPIGGLKVVTANGWFAARPSGTEHIYKIYAESFVGPEHLAAIQTEAKAIVDSVLQ